MATEVKVQEGESIEAALRRFKKAVLNAGIILEVKRRKYYESPYTRKKRKKEESKKRFYRGPSRHKKTY